MSYEQNRTFDLNTAITALPETGVFDEDIHKAQVAPVFRRIKAHDGITKCYVGQYGITVHYMPNVITATQALEIVQEAVRWAADQDGLFPLRGDKTPEASFERAEPAPLNHRQKVYVSFNTDIVNYPPLPGGDFNRLEFDKLTFEVVKRLADTDGVRDVKLDLNAAHVIFDTRVTDADTITEHMRDVFLEFEANDGQMFPKAKNTAELQLTFKTGKEY